MPDIDETVPEATVERCPVVLVLGDDSQKYPCTIHCGLPRGHKNNHQERGNQVARNGTGRIMGTSYYTITWGDPIMSQMPKT